MTMHMLWRALFLGKRKDSLNNNAALFAGVKFSTPSQRLRGRGHGFWVEETFINLSDAELARTDNKNYLGLAVPAKVGFIFLLIIYACLGALLLSAGRMQLLRGDHFYGLAEQNRLRTSYLPAPRGIIYDTASRPLVKNVPEFMVYITPSEFLSGGAAEKRKIDWLNEQLKTPADKEKWQQILSIDPGDKAYREPILLTAGLSYEQALLIKSESADFSGVYTENNARREYLTQFDRAPVSSLAHLLGYTGKINPDEFAAKHGAGYLFNDILGKTGIEQSYETNLRGRFGREQLEVDATGKAIKIIAKEEMLRGDSIFLSIDLAVQSALEQAMREAMAPFGKKRGAAVALDPQTGQVLALISLPGYDNNLFSTGGDATRLEALFGNENKPLFNRAISGEYPSGSTFKPVVAAAALEEGLITENSSFVSTGGIRINEWFFPDWKAGGHGVTNVYKALADSVNTFFYIIGGGYGDFTGLGIEKIKKYAELFGLNNTLGIDLAGEKPGFLPTKEWKEKTKKERWYIGDTYHVAIGQGDLQVTPLQVASYTAVFANNGTLYKPQLVSRYLDQKNRQEVLVKPQIIRDNFISEKSINIVRQGLRQAVTTGSAKILQSLPVSSAAKTGTAQWGEDKTPHAWFTSFAPFNNPEIVLTVLVEEGGEGSGIGAQIANRFLNWYFREHKWQNRD